MTERSHQQWTQPSDSAALFLPGQLALTSFSRRCGSLSGPLRPWRQFQSPAFRRRFQSPAFRRRFQSPAFRRRFQSPAFLFLSPEFRRRFRSPVFQTPMFRSPVFQSLMSQSPVFRIQSLIVQSRFPVSSPVQPRFPVSSPVQPRFLLSLRLVPVPWLHAPVLRPAPRSPSLGWLVVHWPAPGLRPPYPWPLLRLPSTHPF
ncbi:hypothetical protein EYF80_041767 [Liparis tanakae]|uniref:Uncharacterized protein n=1 Tax=Liparis tanakae TaxID=230148 RepID=A0A4Z2G3D5_9TELE|nr:hypothetical protein EYF80_041767 [Liparis tanakae]